MQKKSESRDEYLRRHRIFNRRSRANNIDKVKARARKYYELNKVRINAKAAEWGRLNKAKRKVSRDRWLAKNPGKMMEIHRRKRYKLSAEDFDRLKEAQGGLCAICRVEPAAAVDHCHATGEVRGLLCRGCNTAIGRLGDTSDGVLRAVAYLKAAEQKTAAA